MNRIVSAALLFLMWPAALSAGEDYFMLMFGSQRIPTDPDYSHSFATFVRVCWDGDGPCPKDARIEAHTISWLPCNMIVRTRALCPECGCNFDLHTTLRWTQKNCMRTSLWGAYRICPDVYFWALKQKAHLESGAVRYKAVDSGRNTEFVSNCIHAVANVLTGPRVRVLSPGWGETASFAILRRFERYIIDPDTPHPWVGSALGLDAYPIIYRDWQRPRSGFLGPVYRVLGGERDLVATYGPPVLHGPPRPEAPAIVGPE